MQIEVNGATKDVNPEQSLYEIIESLGLNPKAVVAQRNGDIIDRQAYREVHLQEGDKLELIHFVGGG